MIFFKTADEPDELEEDADDEEATLADDVLDEVEAAEPEVDGLEGFGLIEEATVAVEEEEKEGEEEEGESLEEDAEDVDFDTFDDVDEL